MSNTDEVGVVDMPSFSDEYRGYVEIFGALYQFERVFSTVKQFKILLIARAAQF